MKTGQSSSTARRAPTPPPRRPSAPTLPASRQDGAVKAERGKVVRRGDQIRGRTEDAERRRPLITGRDADSVCKWRLIQAVSGADLQLAVARPQRESRFHEEVNISSGWGEEEVPRWAADRLFSLGALHPSNSNIWRL